MKITNYEIYKLKKSGLTNQQILKVLEYGENVDQELLLGDIADISGCRNPAVFMERYFQIDDAHLSKEFQKFPSFSILDDCYPWDLSEIYDAPVLLFYKGNLDLLKFPKVAVVGSRACSKQGAKSVEKVIQGLENELVIVSGLAKGIDTAAHTLKFHFPARNRIIAGLCRGVIVAEAKMRSGSLITCERAMEEGRDIFAIPGSILDGLSDGCHHLIQEGAKLVTSGQDVLAEFEF
ncbi:TPA: DNA-processing protein DprA [Streptococcus pneumoniae]